MHRWENTLAKYRVLSVTCDHYRRSLGLPLIFVFTYITKNAPCNQSLFALVESPKLYPDLVYLLIFYAPGEGLV